MSNELIMERAKSAEMSHDFTTAARLYKQLIQQDSTNVKYLSALGHLYVTAGEDQKAIPYYEQIYSFHPDNIDSMTALGAIYRRLGRYDDSIIILRKALDLGKKKADVYYNLGFTYKEIKHYDDAIDAFENVIGMNPRDVLTHNHLGSIYYETNKLEDAVLAYKRGLQIDPNHPILNYNLARTFTKLKNYPDAIRCYEAALKTRPHWPEAISNFSKLLVKCQKSVEAARIVKQSIKVHPNNPELLYTLGQVYLNQFDYDNAKKTLTQANAVKSNDVKILTALASAYEKADESDMALETILAAIELEPLNNDVRMQYVDTLLSVNDYNSAFETISSLDSESDGKDVKVMDLYGQYYIAQGEDEKAEQYFDKIQKTDDHYKEYMLGASKRYVQTEKYEDAERYANEYIKEKGYRPEGYNLLGKIFTRCKLFEKARDAYEQGTKVTGANVAAVKGLENLKKLQGEPVEEIPAVVEEPVEEEEVDLGASNESLADQIKPEEIVEEDFDPSVFGDDLAVEAPLYEVSEIASQLEDDGVDIFEDMPKEESIFDEPEIVDTDTEDDGIDLPDEFEVATTKKPVNASPVDAESSEPDTRDVIENAYSFEDAEELPDESENTLEAPSDFAVDSPVESDSVGEAEVESDSEVELESASEGESYDDLPEDVVEEADDSEFALAPTDDSNFDEAFDSDINEDLDTTPFTNVIELYAELLATYGDVDDIDAAETLTNLELQIESGEVIVSESKDTGMDSKEFTPPAESPATGVEKSQKLSEVAEMLKKIEAILSDDNLALKYSSEISMLKRLKTLCEYLPDDEKVAFASGRIRMLIDYLLSKMSGKPGLLLTTKSLLKSGVLGNEYRVQLISECEDDLNNEMLRRVLTYMKKLSESLDDFGLSAALRACADGALEKIEMEDRKSEIF